MPISRPHRRDLLLALAPVTLSGLLPSIADARSQAPAFANDPFKLGVASGSPTSNAIVLWTRLAPEPMAPLGGMPDRAVPVRWVISAEPDLSHPVGSGTAMARPERAHSVHVDARNLASGARYYYRFFVGDVASPIGATRTLPRANAAVSELRFATVSCQNYAQGYFTAYDGIVEDEPDFVLHLGDYIYETGFGQHVREHETDGPISTLDDYRRRHALYKLDPSMARAHAALPFFVTLDNHDAVIDASPQTRALRIAAYRAWLEHMPVRDFLQGPDRAHIGQSIAIGDLAHIEFPDTRQFRDTQDVCAVGSSQDIGFGAYRIPCDQTRDPARSMLGVAQERSVATSFARNARKWNILASTVPFAPYVIAAGGAERAYAASWSAYPAARLRMMQSLRQASIQNVVVLSGDIHSSWVWDVRERNDDPSTTLGAEIVSTSVSSDCPPAFADPLTASVSHNPHVRFSDVAKRGYVLHTVSHDAWRADIRFVEDVRIAKGSIRTGRKVSILSGRPGVADLI